MSKTRMIALRQVRYFPGAQAYSNHVGYKGRLVDISTARRIVRRLKKAGVDCFHVRVPVSVPVYS